MSESTQKNNSKNLLILGWVILVICWLEIVIFWKKIPPQIPWFYSLPWGESQLMRKVGLIMVMASASGLSIATSFIAKWTKKDDQIIEKAVYITLLLTSILLFLTLTKVLMIFIF